MGQSEILQITEREAGVMGAAPVMHYWEVVWNRMYRAGWQLGHTTWTHPDTGGLRHLVVARRGDVRVEQSAPTMTQAVTAVEHEIRSSAAR